MRKTTHCRTLNGEILAARASQTHESVPMERPIQRGLRPLPGMHSSVWVSPFVQVRVFGTPGQVLRPLPVVDSSIWVSPFVRAQPGIWPQELGWNHPLGSSGRKVCVVSVAGVIYLSAKARPLSVGLGQLRPLCTSCKHLVGVYMPIAPT